MNHKGYIMQNDSKDYLEEQEHNAREGNLTSGLIGNPLNVERRNRWSYRV